MKHLHADVTENSHFIQGRGECFTGGSALDESKFWLSNEIGEDCEYYGTDQNELHAMTGEVEEYDGTTEFVEIEMNVSVLILGNAKSFTMGYRIMSIDGVCERTI